MKTASRFSFAEVLRWLFFILYACALGGLVLLVRPFGAFRHEQEGARKIKVDVRSVLPPFDNQPWEEAFEWEGRKVYPAYSVSGTGPKKLLGVAFPVTFGNAENQESAVWLRTGDRNEGLLGIDPGGYVTGFKIIAPENWGGKAFRENADSFFRSLEGRSLGNLSLYEDGGSLDAEPDAADDARAVLQAVRNGIGFFIRNREKLLIKLTPQEPEKPAEAPAGPLIPLPENISYFRPDIAGTEFLDKEQAESGETLNEETRDSQERV